MVRRLWYRRAIAWSLSALLVWAGFNMALAGQPESWYRDRFCAELGGETEVRVKGGRIDCLTDRYAIEVDKAANWKEGIAQARWYAIQTGKIPGLLLITRPGGPYRQYAEEYLHAVGAYVRIWTMPAVR